MVLCLEATDKSKIHRQPKNTAIEIMVMRMAYFDVALGSKVVDLCRFYFINDLHKAGAVSEITIVQFHVFRIFKQKYTIRQKKATLAQFFKITKLNCRF